jgi:hypothetical protein
MKIATKVNITDVKIHSRLHIYSFVGNDVKTRDDSNRNKDLGLVISAFGDLEAFQYFNEITAENNIAPGFIFGIHKDRWPIVGYYLGRDQHWKCLQWMVKNNCSKHEYVFRGALKGGADLEMLKWLHSMGCAVTEETFAHAAYYGNIEMMQWLRAIRCPWNARTFRAAVETGKSIDTLIWLKNEGCPWDEHVFETAVGRTDMRLWLWLRLEGCPWDSRTFTAAVYGTADLLSLRWLHHEKCPWDKKTFIVAVKRGDLDILKWLLEKQCPWDAECIHTAMAKKKGKVLEWLHAQGCPWNETTRDLVMRNLANQFENL